MSCYHARMQLDVESLRTFLAVLDEGGMTRAADTLHLTQSAVSWKIRRLVSEANLRESDVLLWSDQLQWMTCCETPYHDGVVPLITFGENCFYRALSEPLLEENGIDHSVAFSGSSATGVHAAVSAGLGVAVLAERFLGDDLVEWSRGAALAPLPVVHQIARTRSDPDELACALHKAITDEFDSLQSAA